MAPEADCYEDIFSVMRKLNLPNEAMDSTGRWHLAPAYDINFCIDPASPAYMNRHELSINGKKDGITKQDLIEIGKKTRYSQLPTTL